jgi:hypothetical protein
MLFVGNKIVPDGDHAFELPRAESPTIDDLKRNEKAVWDQYSVPAILQFILMLTGLPLCLQRVNEWAGIDTEHINVRIELTFRLNAWSKNLTAAVKAKKRKWHEYILVPLIISKRGVLYDDLRVTSAIDARVPTLSQRDSSGLLVITVRTLFEMAARESPRAQGANDFSLSRNDEDIMWSLIRYVVCHREDLTPTYRQFIEQQLSTINHLSEDISERWHNHPRCLCQLFRILRHCRSSASAT